MIALSPGSAQAGFELLRQIEVQGLTPSGVVEGLGKVERMPADAVLALVQALQWVAVGVDGQLRLTPSGAAVLAAGGYPAQARQALLDHARLQAPPWVQNAAFGRVRVLQFANVGVRQLMVEAELAEAVDDATVAFWDELAAMARRIRDDGLSEIGRRGERLTLAHEMRRTGRVPRWVAIDSNADGYDVLSVRDEEDPAALTIEVKTSSIGVRGALHLTRAEWETALESDAHVFHLWDMSSPAPRLAVVGVAEMAAHMPTDLGQGAWEGGGVPFAAFAEAFRAAA